MLMRYYEIAVRAGAVGAIYPSWNVDAPAAIEAARDLFRRQLAPGHSVAEVQAAGRSARTAAAVRMIRSWGAER